MYPRSTPTGRILDRLTDAATYLFGPRFRLLEKVHAAKINMMLGSGEGESHEPGPIDTARGPTRERARITAIDHLGYGPSIDGHTYLSVLVDTTDGEKAVHLSPRDLRVLAPYVPAETVNELEGCVIPVQFNPGSEAGSVRFMESPSETLYCA